MEPSAKPKKGKSPRAKKGKKAGHVEPVEDTEPEPAPGPVSSEGAATVASPRKKNARERAKLKASKAALRSAKVSPVTPPATAVSSTPGSKAVSPGDDTKTQVSTPPDQTYLLKDPVAKSLKYVGMEPEWNSEQLREEKLVTDGFTCCTVLVMEETPALTPYTQYLHQAVSTGIRRNFTSISGRSIAEKVRRFMTSSGQREAGQEDKSYMDPDKVGIWAEAVKHTLLQYKTAAVAELQVKAKEAEITGARSKEFIRPTQFKPEALESPSTTPTGTAGSTKTKSKPNTPREGKEKKTNSPKAGTATVIGKRKRKGDKKPGGSGGSVETSTPEKKLRSPVTEVVLAPPKSNKPTLLRKRGEFTVPVSDFVDDSPPGGPLRYFFLQGFYNANILPALHDIGVPVDCVMLVTDGPLEKRNFSVLDIEKLPQVSIAKSYRPKNLLPDYARERAEEPVLPDQDPITGFWSRLAEIINGADAQSPLHDVALMNCWLPPAPGAPAPAAGQSLSPEAAGDFASRLFDEAAQRVYEMLVLRDWYGEYKLATETRDLGAVTTEPDSQPSSALYDHLLNQLPAECVTVPIIMECLIEQVVENEKSESNSSPCGVAWDSPGCRIPGTDTIHAHSDHAAALKRHELPAPNYIFNHDNASIRSCHLNRIFASNVASSQVCGELLAIQKLLMDESIPAYNKGMAMKLLGNVHHFMHFMPPGALRPDEMWHTLHLLMAAGLEHKQMSPSPVTSTEEIESIAPSEIEENDEESAYVLTATERFEGTKLRGDHNYLVVEDPAKTQLLLAPHSDQELEVAVLRAPQVPQSPIGGEHEHKAAQIATEQVIETGAEFKYHDPTTSKAPPNTATASEAGEEGEPTTQDFKDPGGTRFVACEPEQEWLDTLAERDGVASDVIRRLLDCPALSGLHADPKNEPAFHMDFIVRTWDRTGESQSQDVRATSLGPLASWNYVETLEPVQMIQALHTAVDSYLCLDRLYCPFYDTLIFTFTNPSPGKLKSETTGQWRLQTLPGLQHFLEYSINEDHVLDWLLEMEKNKGIDLVDTISITTLMRIVPKDQWMLIPSIKYAVLRAQKEAEREARHRHRKLPGSDDESAEAKGEEEGDEMFGQLKKERKKKKVTRPFSGEAGEFENEFMGESRGRSTASAETPVASTPIKVPDIDATLNEVVPASSSPSFNFGDAIKQAKGQRAAVAAEQAARGQQQISFVPPKFHCYDLGKRVLVTGSTCASMYPMDGTRIQYEIHSLEGANEGGAQRSLQLRVERTGAGHSAYFYPFYVPPGAAGRLVEESFVLCPNFHMVHRNGTLYTFQDRRAAEGGGAPFTRLAIRQSTAPRPTTFSYDKVLFIEKLEDYFAPPVDAGDDQADEVDTSKPPSPSGGPLVEADAQEVAFIEPSAQKGKKGRIGSGKSGGINLEAKSTKGKKGKTKKEKSATVAGKDEIKEKKRTKAGAKAGKKGKQKAGATKSEEEEEEEQEEVTEGEEVGEAIAPEPPADGSTGIEAPPPTVTTTTTASEQEETEEGEWKYSSAENTEAEDEIDPPRTVPVTDEPRLPDTVNWTNAVPLLQPMTHSFHITLPSGQHLIVEDVQPPGLPLRRHVKQTYLAKGSASSVIEQSRYITMQGSVVKFMYDKRVQVLTARGVTTNIQEVQALAPESLAETPPLLEEASHVRVRRGEVIFATGERWKIKGGHKRVRPPLFVFSSGVLPNGETFRRRQDGVVHLHRHDGTVITHYPDGTRFTTRMVIGQEPVPEFEDWECVGMKYMVEHPNYATVVMNTLSGNIHLKLSEGEWVRVFADGSVKIGTRDGYKLDVNQNLAVISNPSCAPGDPQIPNLVAIKLWHEPKPVAVQEPPATALQPSNEEAATNVIYSAKAHLPDPSLPPPPKATKSKQSARSTKKAHRPRSRKGNKAKSKLESPRQVDDETEDEVEDEEEEGETEVKPIEIEPAPTHVPKKFDLDNFLNFVDSWTICKAVDCFDNRFSVDVFGSTTAEKCEQQQQAMVAEAREKIATTISQQFGLPRQYVSGILKTTSSTQLDTIVKRKAALANVAQIEACSQEPAARVFVVKRNLSGFEYLTKSHVEKLVAQAKATMGAIVIKDKAHSHQSKGREREAIRILEPLQPAHGLWKSEYREPVFRPRYISSKQLRIARPEDLRWFSYIVTTAHARRPKFFLSPRQAYEKRKKETPPPPPPKPAPASPVKAPEPQPQQEAQVVHLQFHEEMEGEEAHTVEKEKGVVHHAGEKLNAPSSHRGRKPSATESAVTPTTKRKMRRRQSLKKVEKIEQPSEAGVHHHRKGRIRSKKGRKTDAPSKLELASSSVTSGAASSLIDGGAEEGEEEEEKEHREGETMEAEHSMPKVNLELVEIPDYPSKPPKDLLGLYGVDGVDEAEVRAQFHADPQLTRPALVLRNILEIPAVDEKLTRALVAASLSYAQTIEAQRRIYQPQDTRSSDQLVQEKEPESRSKEEQRIIKQRLLEQNLGDLHLQEQTEGNLLQFHL